MVKATEKAGIIEEGEWNEGSGGFQKAWKAICGVWASKWNERAWLSRRARGMSESSLKMAVLLQQVFHLIKAWKSHVDLEGPSLMSHV